MTIETLRIALTIVGDTMDPRNLTALELESLGLKEFPSREKIRERSVEILLNAFQEQQKRIEQLEAKTRKK